MLFTSSLFAADHFYDTIYSTDYPGNDIGDMISDVEPIECAVKCDETEGCVAFVTDANSSSSNNCWLKHTIGTGTSNGDRSLYFQYPSTTKPDGTETTFTNLDHSGDDLEYLPDAAYGDCHELCLAKNAVDKTCFGYVFDKSLGKGCWLKKQFDVNVWQENVDRQMVIMDYKPADFSLPHPN